MKGCLRMFWLSVQSMFVYCFNLIESLLEKKWK